MSISTTPTPATPARDTLPELPPLSAEVDALADSLGSARIMLDLAQPTAAGTAVHVTQMQLRALAARLLMAGLAIAIVAGLSVGSARPAAAAVERVSAPARVVVDSPTETIPVSVRTSAAVDGTHGASVWIGYPGADSMSVGGYGVAKGQAVTVRTELDTRRITRWGALDLIASDDADGDTRALTVDVRRRSNVAITHHEVSGGKVALAVRVRHYQPGRGYISSQRSPVRLQESVAGRWVTRATVTTTVDGLAGARLPLAPGVHRFRAVRPDGASVWSATSQTVRVEVPGGC
jgi:hypothetical protein